MESSELHRRSALAILRPLGGNPRMVVVGFLAATAALSMGISNTATAIMILPVGLAVVGELEGEGASRISTCVMLAIAYGASVRGDGHPDRDPFKPRSGRRGGSLRRGGDTLRSLVIVGISPGSGTPFPGLDRSGLCGLQGTVRGQEGHLVPGPGACAPGERFSVASSSRRQRSSG